jgi:hypothetical protein
MHHRWQHRIERRRQAVQFANQQAALRTGSARDSPRPSQDARTRSQIVDVAADVDRSLEA